MKKAVFLVICAFVVAGWLLPANAQTKPSGKPILIGYMSHLTGPASKVSQQEIAAAQATVEMINEKGGVLGRPIELIPRDDHTDAGVATRVARELVLDKKVNFLAGCSNTKSSLAISEVAKQQKVIYMIATSQTAAITEELGHRYVFRSWSNSSSQIGPAALWVAKGKFKRFVTSAGDYEWGHSNIDTILSLVKKQRTDFEVVKQVWPPYGTSDFSPYLSQIMAAKPDLIIAGHWGSETTNFIRQGKALGLLGKPDSPQVIIYMDQDSKEALGKDMPDGIGAYCAFHTRSIKDPWAEWFDNAVHKRTGSWPGGIALGGYMCISWLAKGIEKAGTTDTEAVVKALEGLEMDTYVGKIKIRECDHQATGVQALGFTKMTPDYPFCVMRDLYYPSGEQFLRTCKEIEALRAAKK